jgi:hypothetical protein
MKVKRQSRYNYWIRAGFLPSEAREFSNISREGLLKAAYVKRLLNSRRALQLNAIRYGWSKTRYADAVRQIYVNRGLLKPDSIGRKRDNIWALLRQYEDQTPDKEKYDSPWRRQMHTKSEVKRTKKVISRKQQYKDTIEVLKGIIERASPGEFRDRKQKELDLYRAELKKLEAQG